MGRPQIRTLLARASLTETLKRANLASAMEAWTQAIVQDLGGDARVSAQERVLLDSAARSWLILASVDDWLFRQQRRRRQVLIDKASKSLFPIVLQRQALERDLRQCMLQLGLKRRSATATPAWMRPESEVESEGPAPSEREPEP